MQTYQQFKQAATSWQDMMTMEPTDAYQAYRASMNELTARKERGEISSQEWMNEYTNLYGDAAGANNDYPGSIGYDWGLHVLNGIEDPQEREAWLQELYQKGILTDENMANFMTSSKWGYTPPDPIPPGPIRFDTGKTPYGKSYFVMTNFPEKDLEQMRKDSLNPIVSAPSRFKRNIKGSPYVTLRGYKPGNREKLGDESVMSESNTEQSAGTGMVKQQSYREFCKFFRN